jgi:O-antigen ligase
LCVLALAQYFTGPDSRLIYWSIKVPPSSFGPFVNHNNFGGLMEMLIPVSVGYILTRPYDSLAPLLLWGVVIVAIVSVWISGSRAATAALLIEGLVFGAILLRQPMPEFRRRALPLLIGVVVIAVPVFTWMIGARMASNRAWSIFSSDRPLDATIGDRLWVGKSTLHMAASHPWIGVGVGCFELAFPTYASTPTDWHWTHAHDDYAEALAETGLPGAVILVTALVLFFRLAWRHLSDRLRHTAGWIQLGAAVGCVGLMAHSFVEFNLRVPSNGAWFVVCLAIAVHPRSSGVRARRLERFSPPDHAGDFLN